MERFAIPGDGAIIRRSAFGCEQVLLQERRKKNAPPENGLLEIPAGKIGGFKSVFDTVRREVKEETGLEICGYTARICKAWSCRTMICY